MVTCERRRRYEFFAGVPRPLQRDVWFAHIRKKERVKVLGLAA